jgi:hypothetical protein
MKKSLLCFALIASLLTSAMPRQSQAAIGIYLITSNSNPGQNAWPGVILAALGLGVAVDGLVSK